MLLMFILEQNVRNKPLDYVSKLLISTVCEILWFSTHPKLMSCHKSFRQIKLKQTKVHEFFPLLEEKLLYKKVIK